MRLDEHLRSFIDSLDSGWTVPEAAEKFLADVPSDVLLEWQDARVRAHIAVAIRTYTGNQRRQAVRSAFTKAAAELDPDDVESCSHFRSLWTVDGVQMRLADMRRDDCITVANDFEADANEFKFRAAMHRAIAKKLTGGKKVSEVFTEEQIDNLIERLK